MIITTCCQGTYEIVPDFQWYLELLVVDLAYYDRTLHCREIYDTLLDVVRLVRAARRCAVKLMVKVLSDDTLELCACSEVLLAVT